MTTETPEHFERRVLEKALEMTRGFNPAFNMGPTLTALRQILSFEGWDVVKRDAVGKSEGQK